MQKKWIIAAAVAGAVLLLVIASFVLGIIGVSRGVPKEPPAQDTLTVYGQGVVTAAPDIARVTLGYENYGSDPTAAQQSNAEIMKLITAAAAKAGVAQADICESGFNIYQEYYYYDSANTESNYCVSSTVDITVRQLDQLGGVISAACGTGANITYGITYGVADCKHAYAQALESAHSRAEEKAGELADKLKRAIAGVAQVKECGAAQSAGGEYWDDGSVSPLADFAAETASKGRIIITAAVYVTYRLE